MKNFSIHIYENTPEEFNGILTIEGEIIIKDHKETFIMPLDWWTINDYQKQWKEGIARIKTHDSSCLVATIQDLNIRPWVEMWVLYKEGTKIFIQNHLISGNDFREMASTRPEFNLETCYDYIEPRRTVFDDGDQISEWVIDLSDLQ